MTGMTRNALDEETAPPVKVLRVGSVKALTDKPGFLDEDTAHFEQFVLDWLDEEMGKLSAEYDLCQEKTVVMMAAEPDPGRFGKEMGGYPEGKTLDEYASIAVKKKMFRLNVGLPFLVAKWVAGNPTFNLLHISTSYVYMEEGPLQAEREIQDSLPGNATGLHPFDSRNDHNGQVSEKDYAPYAPQGAACVVAGKIGTPASLVQFLTNSFKELPAHIQTRIQRTERGGIDYPVSKLLAELAVQCGGVLNPNASYLIVRLPTMVGTGNIFGSRPCGGAKYCINVTNALDESNEDSAVKSILMKSPSWRTKGRNMCSYNVAGKKIAAIAMAATPSEAPEFEFHHAAGTYSESDAQYHAAICKGLQGLIDSTDQKYGWMNAMIEALGKKDAEETEAEGGAFSHTNMPTGNSVVVGLAEFEDSIQQWIQCQATGHWGTVGNPGLWPVE